MRKLLKSLKRTLDVTVSVALLGVCFTACSTQINNSKKVDLFKQYVKESVDEISQESNYDTGEISIGKTPVVSKYDEVEIAFVDVGQGDCTIITEGDKCVIIDAGPGGENYTPIKSFLFEKGISDINTLILTHPDADHIGGADDIMKDFNVKTLITNGDDKDTEAYRNMEALSKKVSSIIVVDSKDYLTVGNLDFTLYCTDTEYEDINSRSIITRLCYGSKTFLFMGDATGEEVAEMTSQGANLTCDVLKLAHHGSANCGCNQDTLLCGTREAAIISCGLYNDYGHPHKETMALLNILPIDVYRTDLMGTVICRTNGNDISFDSVPTTDYTNGNALK